MCKDCLLKEIGAGQTTCAKHGDIQIDWKCMYCCSTALFRCFGTHFMCEPCHSSYNWGIMPLHDCHGVNCPLGVAHPPPHNDPKKGGVFPLGCGICRSEKLELINKYKELNNGFEEPDEKPKAWIYNGQAQIERPKVEIEVPEFIYRADEIQEERELQAKALINRTPVPYQTPRQIAKAKRLAAKKAIKKANGAFDDLPAWFLNPENEVDELEEQPIIQQIEHENTFQQAKRRSSPRAKVMAAKRIRAIPRVSRRKHKLM